MFVKIDCDKLLQIMKERKIPKLALCSVAQIPPVAFGRYLLMEVFPIRAAQSISIILQIDPKEIIKGEYRI